MKQWTSEMLAVSRAGHDKGGLFVVVASDDTWLWLADGKRRRLEAPKKKKRIHAQVITHLPGELLARMQVITTDAHVRQILRDYRGMGAECEAGTQSTNL